MFKLDYSFSKKVKSDEPSFKFQSAINCYNSFHVYIQHIPISVTESLITCLDVRDTWKKDSEELEILVQHMVPRILIYFLGQPKLLGRLFSLSLKGWD